MKSRDWLIQQGLAKPARGRLPREAKLALIKAVADGMKFDDIKDDAIIKIPKPARTKQHAAPIEIRSKVRNNTAIWGIDKASKDGQQDIIISFDSCASCSRPIQYCTHDIPLLPSWLNSDTYMERPG